MKETRETRMALIITYTCPVFLILIARSDTIFDGERKRATS